MDDAASSRALGQQADRFDFNACSETVLNYCTFASDAQGCFAQIETEYESRAAKLMAAFPDQIEAPKVQQTIYDNRIEVLRDLENRLLCPSQSPPAMCDARAALIRWNLARPTVEWIAKFEEDK